MPTLLLADDSVTVQRVIALTFAEEPIEVVAVGDGRQAMEKLAAVTPDLVLAGTTLPHVNGYDLAKFMRSKRELQRIPVLLLAGAFESVDEARLKASGANGVIEKPVEPTIVISRVKELLGLKTDDKPAATGRLVTTVDAGAKKMPAPTPPRAVTSTRGTPSKWEQLRNQTGLDANTRSVEDPSSRSADYLDSLDDAFDTLDRQLSGRAPRNPAGPLGPSRHAGDPRSPGRLPSSPAPDAGNPVFEVDDEWFGAGENSAAVEARANRSEIAEDLRQPDWQPPKPDAAPDSIYEVDDEWFKDADRARAAKADEHQRLAEDMGIHDVELPPREATPAVDLDFDLGGPVAEPVQTEAPRTDAPTPEAAPAAGAVEPPRVEAKPAPLPVSPGVVPPPIQAPPMATPRPAIADDFAELLAFEQGERQEPPASMLPPPPEIRVVTPEITPAMLDDIASRVADRLNASVFGDSLRDAMTAAVRETVRAVVSETSERLVREEIDRIKSKKS